MAIDKKILRESFEVIKPIAGKVVDRFYETLFGRYPAAATLFKGEKMPGQKMALIQSLAKIMELLENGPELQVYLTSLGARHDRYGVKAEHYDWVAECLLDTLSYFFDDTWTRELEGAWMAALGLVAETMRSALTTAVTVKDNSGSVMKAQIESALRAVMREALVDLAEEKALRELAKAKAKLLIEEALQEQLTKIKDEFSGRKAA